jgi:hypothetical protein
MINLLKTGWLPETMVIKDRIERFTNLVSGFAEGH